MPKRNLLEIIDSFLWVNPSSLERIIWPNVIKQIEEIRDRTLAVENNNNNLSKINFNSDDNIDIFQENIYLLDETLTTISIKSEEQLNTVLLLLNNMLDYIVSKKDEILALEWVKLQNIKNNFRAIQYIIKSKIDLQSQELTQVITRFNQLYPHIIPPLPVSINTEEQANYFNNLNFKNFDESEIKVFKTMINNLENICNQVINNTDNFKKIQEKELYELQYSLENLLNTISSKLYEIEVKNYNNENLSLPKIALNKIIWTINNAKEKVKHYLKIKEVKRNIRLHINEFPKIEKKSIMNKIDPYKDFINQIDNINNYLLSNDSILCDLEPNYINEILLFLHWIKEKLDYVIEKHNPNNTDHLKYFFPANRLSAVIKWLIEKLEFKQSSFQN